MKKYLSMFLIFMIISSLVSCNFGNGEKQIWLEESMIDHFENRSTYSFYDEYGNLIKTVQEDAAGNIVATRYMEYDANNNLIKTSLDSGSGELFVQLLQAYDENGRLIEKRQMTPSSETVSTYDYDELGRIISINRNDTLYETYTYNEDGDYEVRSAKNPDEYALYFADGRISERHLNNGTMQIFSYNDNGNLTECAVYSGENLRYKQIYHLDEHGNTLKVTQVNASGTETVLGEYKYKLYTIKTK